MHEKQISDYKMNLDQLLAEVKKHTENNIKRLEDKFAVLDDENLNKKASSKSWSAAECFKHLIVSNEFYLKYFPGITDQNRDKKRKDSDYKPTLTGKILVSMVNPENVKKGKAPGFMDPAKSSLKKDVVKRMLEDNKKILSIAEAAQNLDLNGIKVPLSITSLIKISLADTLLMLAYHSTRHINQAERAAGIK